MLTHITRGVATALVASIVFAGSAPAGAQAYPSKPIRLLVPLAAGSTADIVSRFAAQELGKALGQSVVVENKPGAGGTIAMAEVARATPDGYTIAFASQGTLVFNQAIYANPGYDSTKDFAPIAFVGGVSNVMIVPPTSTATKPSDVIAEAKAKPGQPHVLVGRKRNEPPPLRRAVRPDDRDRSRPRSLQGRAAGCAGGDDGRSVDGVLQYAHGDRPDQGRKGEGARRHQPQALAALPDCRRSTSSESRATKSTRGSASSHRRARRRRSSHDSTTSSPGSSLPPKRRRSSAPRASILRRRWRPPRSPS